jgi:hypothetical protein
MEVHINYWRPTEGKVPNACVRGFGDQTTSLEVRYLKANHAYAWDVHVSARDI